MSPREEWEGQGLLQEGKQQHIPCHVLPLCKIRANFSFSAPFPWLSDMRGQRGVCSVLLVGWGVAEIKLSQDLLIFTYIYKP